MFVPTACDSLFNHKFKYLSKKIVFQGLLKSKIFCKPYDK